MNVAPIIAGKQQQILRRFRDLGATSADRARSPREVGCRESAVFRGLARRGVLREAGHGTYYLDTDTADAFEAKRRRGLFVALLTAAALAAAMLLAR